MQAPTGAPAPREKRRRASADHHESNQESAGPAGTSSGQHAHGVSSYTRGILIVPMPFPMYAGYYDDVQEYCARVKERY